MLTNSAPLEPPGHDTPDSTHGSVLQRYFNFYRLASYTLALFALGRTFGALANTPDALRTTSPDSIHDRIATQSHKERP